MGFLTTCTVRLGRGRGCTYRSALAAAVLLAAFAFSLGTLSVHEREREALASVSRQELASLDIPRPLDNVVFVLDASGRSEPFRGQPPGFRDYGLMLAASTCSMSSETMILTGTTRAPDAEHSALRTPTLFQHAKRWGYRTVLLDVRGTAFPNGVIRASDLRSIDEWIGGDEIPGPSAHPALNAADFAHHVAREGRGNFIFILRQAAHEELSAVAPDAFLRVLTEPALSNTTLFWTSEHGHGRRESGHNHAECSREIEHAVVPFFVVSDSPWVSSSPEPPRPQEIVFSHHNLYPSVVSLLAKDRDASHRGFASLFARRPEQPPLYYLAGGLFAGGRVIHVSRDDLAGVEPALGLAPVGAR